MDVSEGLIVGIGINNDKMPLFTPRERVELIRDVTADVAGIRVETFDGLAVDFVHRCGAGVMVRGLRPLTDVAGEFTMMMANRQLDPDIETVFLMADEEFAHVSSSLIKQITPLSSDEKLAKFVPAQVHRRYDELVVADRQRLSGNLARQRLRAWQRAEPIPLEHSLRRVGHFGRSGVARLFGGGGRRCERGGGVDGHRARRRQHVLEDLAVDVPDGHEQGRANRSDDEPHRTEQQKATQCRKQDQQVRKFGVLPDEPRTEEIVDGADDQRTPRAETYGTARIPRHELIQHDGHPDHGRAQSRNDAEYTHDSRPKRRPVDASHPESHAAKGALHHADDQRPFDGRARHRQETPDHLVLVLCG